MQYNPSVTRTYQAGEDLSTSQFCGVKLDTSNQNQVLLSDDGVPPFVGIVLGFATTGKEGDAVEVLDPQSGVSFPVLAAEAILVGGEVSLTTDGKAQAATSGEWVIGIAIEAASEDGDVIEVAGRYYKKA